MSDELVVFPVAIGRYRHYPPLDVDAEVARVVELFAEFGGREVPWALPMPYRGGDAIAERLGAWSEARRDNTVLYWVGHGWSNTETASLATGSFDGTAILWDLTNPAQARRLSPPLAGAFGPGNTKQSVHSVAFSPDGRTLSFGSYDAILWDLTDPAQPSPANSAHP